MEKVIAGLAKGMSVVDSVKAAGGRVEFVGGETFITLYDGDGYTMYNAYKDRNGFHYKAVSKGIVV